MDLNSTNQYKNIQNVQNLNFSELVLVKLDQNQVIVYGISSFMSIYLFLCTLVYTIYKWKDKLRSDNCLCLINNVSNLLVCIIILVRILFWENYFVTCRLLKTSIFAQVTASRCSTHLVFRSRYKSMEKSTLKQKRTFYFTIYIMVASILQLLIIYTTSYGYETQTHCIYGTPDYKLSVYGNLFLFLTVFVVQIIILVMVIKPILRHCKNIDQTNISSLSMKLVLKRLFSTLVSFVVSDVLLMVSGVVLSRKNTWLPVFTLINMNINSLSLTCSFVDYKRRLMPLIGRKEIEEESGLLFLICVYCIK